MPLSRDSGPLDLDQLTDPQRKLLLRVAFRGRVWVRGSSKRVAGALVDGGLVYVCRAGTRGTELLIELTDEGREATR